MSGKRSSIDRSLRPLGMAEVVWGAVLLGGGQGLFGRLQGRSPDETERIALGALGARHVAQGLLEVAVPDRLARLYTGVDAIHAASMLLIALLQPDRRRAATASGALAALAGLRAWRCR